MPQQTSNKKVVASKGGRKISTPAKIIFVLLAILITVTLGTVVYNNQRAANLKAKAANWTELGVANGPSGRVAAWGCTKGDKATVIYVADAQKPYPYVTLNYSYKVGKGEVARSNSWWGYVTVLQTDIKQGALLSGGHVWNKKDLSNTSIFKDTDPYKWKQC